MQQTIILKTAIDHRKLAQYAQPQNDFSTGLRTRWVCLTVLKIIFRPSLYANLSTPITAFRFNPLKPSSDVSYTS